MLVKDTTSIHKPKDGKKMESRVITKNGLDYIVYEDGRVFYPEREIVVERKNGTVFKYKRRYREAVYNIQYNGYVKVTKWLKHRLVAEAFLEPQPHPSYTINHKDGNKLNNHWSNLEWIPHDENCKHWIYSERGIGRKTHPIEAFDKEGNSVGVFDSKTSAANYLGLHKSTVTYVLQGKLKQTGGYTLKLIDKEEYYARRETDRKSE